MTTKTLKMLPRLFVPLLCLAQTSMDPTPNGKRCKLELPLRKGYANADHSDVLLKISDGKTSIELPAHRVVLALSSKVLAAQLLGSMLEAKSKGANCPLAHKSTFYRDFQ